MDADFIPRLPSRAVNPSPSAPIVLDNRLEKYLLDYFSGPNHNLAARRAPDLSCCRSYKERDTGRPQKLA